MTVIKRNIWRQSDTLTQILLTHTKVYKMENTNSYSDVDLIYNSMVIISQELDELKKYSNFNILVTPLEVINIKPDLMIWYVKQYPNANLKWVDAIGFEIEIIIGEVCKLTLHTELNTELYNLLIHKLTNKSI